jgi:PAS domain S-box-containing protein
MSGYKKHWIKSFTGQTILDAMPEVAYVFNKEQELLMWNKNTEIVLEYTAEELYRKNALEFVEESAADKNTAAFENLFSTHGEQIIYQNLVSKTGKKIPILDTANYATIDGEEYLIGLAIDISQLRKTEEQLQKAIVELHKLKELLQEENVYLKEEYKGHYDYNSIIGKCELTQKAIKKVDLVAPTHTTVLLTGEIGTRKELYARIIHNKSLRSNHPFIMADCSKSTELLTETKLFGYEKRSIPSGFEKRIGKIEMANKGTLFLYEVGELSMELQTQLFRVLNEGTFERTGSEKIRKVDIRVIASTRHNLLDLINKGLFREDLYYRLNVYPIHMSPLRNRIIDIPLLAQHFLDSYNQKLSKSIQRISKKTIDALKRYSWPGNVRELENVIERGVIVSNGSLLRIEPFQDDRNKDFGNGFLTLAEFEKDYIIQVLESTLWRVEGSKGAAQILDMHPETLRSRMRKLEIKRP